MRELFEYIEQQINLRLRDGNDVPIIKTVRLWNNQFEHSNGTSTTGNGRVNTNVRNEKAFKYPACFIEFIVVDVFNRALGIKDMLLTVRFRFGLESYKFEKIETLDFVDKFDSVIQLMAPADHDVMSFTTFQELPREYDEDHNNVDNPYIDYRTLFRNNASYKRKNDVIATADVIVTGEAIKWQDL